MSPHPSTPRPPRGRYQFTLGTLFLITALVSVLAAALGGLWRAQVGELSVPAHYFLMMAVAAPVGTMIVVSLGLTLVQWLKRRRRR